MSYFQKLIMLNFQIKRSKMNLIFFGDSVPISHKVPVVIDSDSLDTEFIRTVYFRVELDSPYNMRFLLNPRNRINLLLLNFEGIILSNINGEKFRSDNDFDELLDWFENYGLSVSPTTIYFHKKYFINKINRGDFCRVEPELFDFAIKYNLNNYPSDNFPEYANQISLSENETKSFKNWSLKILNNNE